MATLLFTRSNSTRLGLKKKTLAERVTLGANTLVIIIISLICFVSVSYLVHSNKTAAKGYVLKELREEEQVLSAQANYWALKVSREQSLGSLKASHAVAKMKKADQIVYMNNTGSQVALLK